MKSAFTLIESIIYMAVVSIVTVGMVQFSIGAMSTGEKSHATQEVIQNAYFAMDVMRRTIQSAESVSAVSLGELVLSMEDSTKNPTLLNLEERILKIKEGLNESIALTSKAVEVTDLQFIDLSSSNRTQSIQVVMTLNNEFTLQSTASVREQSD